MKSKGFLLYKIYYKSGIVYLGRTKQKLQDRIRGHFFKKPMHRTIDIHLVTNIEYAEFQTEADMNLYEIYYINLLKPPFNLDDKTPDELTIRLPEIEFKTFDCSLMEKWKGQITQNTSRHETNHKRFYEIPEEISSLRHQRSIKEITEDNYYDKKQTLTDEMDRLRKELF